MRKRTCLLRTNTRAWKRCAKSRREALSWQCRRLCPGQRWSREPGVNLWPWRSCQRAVLPEPFRNLWTTLIAAPEAPVVPGPLLSRPPRCRAPRRPGRLLPQLLAVLAGGLATPGALPGSPRLGPVPAATRQCQRHRGASPAAGPGQGAQPRTAPAPPPWHGACRPSHVSGGGNYLDTTKFGSFLWNSTENRCLY